MHKFMAKNIKSFMIPKKIIKKQHFFAINLWVQIAHKFIEVFFHKLMPKNIHKFMAKNIKFFMIPKKIIKKQRFFAINLWVQIAHKFMVVFFHKLMPKICINLWQKTSIFLYNS